MVLGWIVYRTGAIFPAMIAHGVYDATKMALASYAVKTMGVEKVLAESSDPNAAARDANWWLVALGAAMLVAGWVLIRTKHLLPLPGTPGRGRR
jgi:membrane protease YdiL (CAAX protease family)